MIMRITMVEPNNNSAAGLFKRHPQAVFTELDGETALFQAETCEYLVLNDTGSAIWDLIGSSKSMDEICKQLLETYEVSEEICRQETASWLNLAVDKKVALRISNLASKR